MAELKTKLTGASVEEFLNAIVDETKRGDSFAVMELMRQVSGEEPRMWGSSIVGFGDRHYQYASGREGDWFVVGFSPRKDALTLYLSCADVQNGDLKQKLGKYKAGKGCLYIKRLADVDLGTLEEIISRSVKKLST
ncbi:MAG TPA: DUF1801 domain-containing protein [Anaerolineales bacterium]|nr:DUF1801 domain-containing protein [Anaerolineales bacterium]